MSTFHKASDLVAWITSDRAAETVMTAEKPAQVIASMVYLPADHPDMTAQGWVKAGTASITVELFDTSALVENKIESLKAKKTKTLADAQMVATDIERQIQNLLAIANESA